MKNLTGSIFFEKAKYLLSAFLFFGVFSYIATAQTVRQSSTPPPPPPSPAQPMNTVTAPEQTLKKNNDMQGPFYLVDESPLQVIKILESLSGQVALSSPQLPDAKINFATSGKLPRNEAILAFKSLLAVNGIAITPMGDKFFKAIPSTGVNTQAPEFIFGKSTDMPPSQFFYSKLYELKYLDIDTFKDSLSPFISPNNIATLTVFSRSNAFMLTDTLVNHQRIELLLDRVDKAPEIREEIEFFMLKNVSADDLKRRLTTIQNESLKKYFDKTSIDADDRTNQLVVVTNKGNMKNIAQIIDKLDVDAQPLTKSEVFYIRHGEAKDVANVLNQIVKGQQAAVKSAQNSKTAAAQATNRNNRILNAQNQAAGNKASVRLPTNLTADATGAALQFSEYITIVADERSNSIVCYGTPIDLKQISSIIEKVDIVLSQVKIDVIITEVTLADKQVSGLSTFGLNYTTIKTDGKKGWSGNTATYSLSDSDATPAFSFSMDETGFAAVFNVAEQNNMVKVLSAPSIVTTHNKEASIIVSRQYPLIQGSTTSYTSAVNPTVSSTINWKDIGVELTVTPLIGENGVIQMKIKQQVSSVVDHTTIDNNIQPIIGVRKAESFVSSKTGETIVLGGLQQSTITETDGAVWLLSDIPLVGELFKPSRDNIERTELIFFIRPTIVYSAHYSKVLLDEIAKDSKIKNEVENYFESGQFHKKSDNVGKFEKTAFERTLMPTERKSTENDSRSKLKNQEDAKKSDSETAEEKSEAKEEKSKRISSFKK